MFPVDVGGVQVYAGDTVTLISARVLEDDGVTPTDLSDWSNWRAGWRVNVESEDVLALAVSAAGEQVSVTASPAVSREIAGRRGVFDVEATDANGVVRTWFRGVTLSRLDVVR